MGVEVFAIGVGSFDDSELIGIASLPKATHKYSVTDYTSLTQITKDITRGACKPGELIVHLVNYNKKPLYFRWVIVP